MYYVDIVANNTEYIAGPYTSNINFWNITFIANSFSNVYYEQILNIAKPIHFLLLKT